MKRPRSLHAWSVFALTVALLHGAAAFAQGSASAASSATTPATRPLTLASAWQAALAYDPTLRAARAAALSGSELTPQAKAQLLPQLSLSLGSSRDQLTTRLPAANGTPFDRKQRYTSDTSTVSLRQSLYGPALDANVRQAQAQSAETEAQLEQARQELATRLAQAYFELLLADDQIQLVQAQTTAHATQLDAARKALAAGSGVRTDIDEAQARLDLDAAQALEARQERELSQRRLQQLVGDVPIVISPVDIQQLRDNPPEPRALDDWLALAELHSPELQALQRRRDAAAADIDKARARHLPTLDAVAQYARGHNSDVSHIDTSTHSTSIGLQLNVPLFSGGAVDSAVRQAVAELTRNDEAAAALRLDLALRLHREHRGVTEGLARIRALEQAVRSSEQAVRSSRRSYEAGVRTTLDVLNAEQQLAVAQRDLAQSRYGVLLSFVRLQSIAGVFDDSRLSQLDGWLVAPASPISAAPAAPATASESFVAAVVSPVPSTVSAVVFGPFITSPTP